MLSSLLSRRVLFVFLVAVGCPFLRSEAASAVWKVTGENGATLYLGGSVHVLRKSDYPLPASYNRALDASQRLVLEMTRSDIIAAQKGLIKEGVYPRGDSLKNHVDPRTYAYLRRICELRGASIDEVAKLKPWFLALIIRNESLGPDKSVDLGVEEFLTARARASHKPVSGLETVRDGIQINGKLTDREAEAQLLLLFIPLADKGHDYDYTMRLWRRGDVDLLTRETRAAFADYPPLLERQLDMRNKNWMPKIVSYLGSRQTCFVVVGAAHLGGSNGLLAMLRARGYKLEQL